jgi:hypothetical protein
MRDVVEQVLDAYGGRTRWARVTAISAHQTLGGELWARRDNSALAVEGEITVWVKDQRAVIRPFGASDLKAVYSPGRVSIETIDGDLIELLTGPRASFDGQSPWSAWTDLQTAYFTGYAMWTYLAEPFSLTMPGVIVRAGRGRQEGPQLVTVQYPPTIATHCAQQTLHLDAGGLIRRRDYHVDVAGALPVAHYVDDFVDVDGIVVPLSRAIYPRDSSGDAIRERLLASIELADVRVL